MVKALEGRSPELAVSAGRAVRVRARVRIRLGAVVRLRGFSDGSGVGSMASVWLSRAPLATARLAWSASPLVESVFQSASSLWLIWCFLPPGGRTISSRWVYSKQPSGQPRNIPMY